MNRSIEIIEKTGEVVNSLELTKVTRIMTDVEMIHFDKLKDGTWRLTYNGKTINDTKHIDCLKFKRED